MQTNAKKREKGGGGGKRAIKVLLVTIKKTHLRKKNPIFYLNLSYPKNMMVNDPKKDHGCFPLG